MGNQTSQPYWKNDNDVKNCFKCQLDFTVYRRRHHCRNCGQIFCNVCSSQRFVLPFHDILSPERVCDECANALKSSEVPVLFPESIESTVNGECISSKDVTDSFLSTINNVPEFSEVFNEKPYSIKDENIKEVTLVSEDIHDTADVNQKGSNSTETKSPTPPRVSEKSFPDIQQQMRAIRGSTYYIDVVSLRVSSIEVGISESVNLLDDGASDSSFSASEMNLPFPPSVIQADPYLHKLANRSSMVTLLNVDKLQEHMRVLFPSSLFS